jgi:alpha-tubulin suppressor-like RCC1 family protein
MNTDRTATSRLAGSLRVSLFLLIFARCALAATDGTLLIFRNPTNSSPRIISTWGGAEMQIVLKSDGSVWDWGLNSSGQLGIGTTNNSPVPVQVLGPGGSGYLGPVAAIMGGEQHNFALRADGTVWAWGLNIFGQLGDGTSNWGSFTNRSTTPVQVNGLTSVKSLGGRGYHSLALKTDGTVWAWGDNNGGQLGNGTASLGTNTPVQVIGLTNPASISGGGFFSLALMPDGTVRSWGSNPHGECGDGTTSNRYTPVVVAGLTNMMAISGGWVHALALKSDGTAWAWGNNGNGELGDGTAQTRYAPVQVSGLSNVVSVSAGDGNSMARLSDGTVWKWGRNDMGQLGIGTSDNITNVHPLPVQVPGLGNVVLSAARDYHNIVVNRDGTVWVWGDNRGDCCGDTTGNNVLSPRPMAGLVSNHTIPYADSFESYANGFSILGTNFWYADSPAAAVVTATNYTASYNGTFPITGPHQLALKINGAVTNRFCPSYCTNVWADTILQASPPTNPAPPTADALTNASFALYVTTDRKLAVWNATNAPAQGNGWTELLDADLSSSQFFRLTVQANYTPDANGTFYYSVWVNGVPSTNPRARYAAADSSQPWFGEIVADGSFFLDDLVVGTHKSFYALQASSAGYGGAISPAGAVIVTPGSTNTFTMTSSNWYHLGSVTIDGGSIGAPASYTFTNVIADHTIVANYAADLAANNTPKWWLYAANTNWSTNFDAATLGDQDGDGMFTWQEYIAGTGPTDPTSDFSLTIALTNGQQIVSFPTIATTAHYGTQRYYALESSTNLFLPQAWTGIAGWTNIPASGQTVAYTNVSGSPSTFFRARVWLGP